MAAVGKRFARLVDGVVHFESARPGTLVFFPLKELIIP